jgi:hypothetical protein
VEAIELGYQHGVEGVVAGYDGGVKMMARHCDDLLVVIPLLDMA